MVNYCANPNCHKPLHYLRDGKIFLFSSRTSSRDSDAFSLEHFWLCGGCAKGWTLTMDGEHSIHLQQKKRHRFRATFAEPSTASA